MAKNFCIYNNELTKIETLNKAPIFVVNECEKEDIRLYNTRPFCLSAHVENICKRLKKRNVEIPNAITTQNIDHQIHRLLNVNKVYKGGFCQLLVFWQIYPEKSSVNYCLFVSPLDEEKYFFNREGLVIQINTTTKTIQTTDRISSFNLAEDNIFTCNCDNSDRISDIEGADILFLQNDTIFVTDNTLPFTKLYVSFLERNSWKVSRKEFLTKNDLLQCNDIVLCSSFIGLQWVSKVLYCENSTIATSYHSYDYARTLHAEMQKFITEL